MWLEKNKSFFGGIGELFGVAADFWGPQLHDPFRFYEKHRPTDPQGLLVHLERFVCSREPMGAQKWPKSYFKNTNNK